MRLRQTACPRRRAGASRLRDGRSRARPPPTPTGPADDLAGSARPAAPAADRDRPLWRRPRSRSPTSGCPAAPRPPSDRADGPWRLLADRHRRPHDHELDRRGSAAARHRRLEHRLSRRRPARRRLSRHLPGRRGGGRRAARACRPNIISISRAWSRSATAPAAISRSGWPGRPRLPRRLAAAQPRDPLADPRGRQPRRPARPRGSGALRQMAAATRWSAG